MTASGSDRESVFSFGHNWVGGDQVNQSGSFNVGKIDLGADDRRLAADELRRFVADLEARGILGAGGEVLDEHRLVAAVVEGSGRLRGIARALAGGARSFLIGVVTNAATPSILQLIEKFVR